MFNVLPDSSGPSFDSQPSAISDISCNDNLPIQETLTASDLCGVTNVTASVDDFIADNCAGYAITYRWVASDDCGNETTVSTVFNVLPDSSGPSFDSQPSAIGDISCNDNLPIQETLTASDLCGVTNVTASVDDFIVDNCAGYAITYRLSLIHI